MYPLWETSEKLLSAYFDIINKTAMVSKTKKMLLKFVKRRHSTINRKKGFGKHLEVDQKCYGHPYSILQWKDLHGKTMVFLSCRNL